MMIITKAPSGAGFWVRLRSFWKLTKPGVLCLIVFCASIGMLLSVPPGSSINWFLFGASILGIWLVAASAAVINCLVEHKTDAIMKRTNRRPLPQALLNPLEALLFSLLVGAAGVLVLHFFVNDLTLGLTLLAFVGYAFFYTIVLKPMTPQNIVIGGSSGAMPPVLGWSAMSGTLTVHPWLLFLIIFLWTPPHFWSLSLYRRDEYAKAGFPMLPVTHGVDGTIRSIVLYTFVLVVSSFLPCLVSLSGELYGVCAAILGGYFLKLTVCLVGDYSDEKARYVFFYSIAYLFLLFLFMLLDHYWFFYLTRM
ncbi:MULTISPECIES: heme o synthase [Candidatus Ichthyocystis]|uniref:Protoheme IX farnesyltransferase n=1 Tax=Candidatus Ichthyocystis hellenicum TaxID=1561003 RepID=A0A0S4M1W4_9BURK|nr:MULTISPECIES: heme o synthase [Ichthyocystis]CUT17007.1 protoheme IX farnesyltransferase [Candidatus Ichthyocystis hellenicum]